MNTHIVNYKINDIRREIKFRQALSKLNLNRTYRMEGMALLKNSLTTKQVSKVLETFVSHGDQIVIMQVEGEGNVFGFEQSDVKRLDKIAHEVSKKTVGVEEKQSS